MTRSEISQLCRGVMFIGAFNVHTWWSYWVY